MGGSRASATINRVVLRELVALDDDNDPDFSSNLIREFFALAEKVILSIMLDLTENDLSRMPTHTHHLSDSSSAMGFTEIHSLAQKLLVACHGEAAQDAAEMAPLWTIVRALKAEKLRLYIELRHLYLKPTANPILCPDLGRSGFG